MIYLAVIVVSYVAFVLLAQHFNPLIKSTVFSKRKQLTFARNSALIVLFSGLAVHFVGDMNGLSLLRQLVAYFVISGFLIFPSAIDYRRQRVWI